MRVAQKALWLPHAARWAAGHERATAAAAAAFTGSSSGSSGAPPFQMLAALQTAAQPAARDGSGRSSAGSSLARLLGLAGVAAAGGLALYSLAVSAHADAARQPAAAASNGAAASGSAAAKAASAAAGGSPSPSAGAPAKDSQGRPMFTADQVARHKTLKDRVWVTYKDGVYDITDFIELHPGGERPQAGSVRWSTGEGTEAGPPVRGGPTAGIGRRGSCAMHTY
jgi:hypothetical protein